MHRVGYNPAGSQNEDSPRAVTSFPLLSFLHFTTTDFFSMLLSRMFVARSGASYKAKASFCWGFIRVPFGHLICERESEGVVRFCERSCALGCDEFIQ